MKYVVAIHILTGTTVNLPVSEISDEYKVINGIQFDLPDGTKPFVEAEIVEDESDEEKFEFEGKEYKTERGMKAAMTRAAKKAE
jgi:hypothetical protein|tara:strand:+ start:9538 stop:9789 length:252 start_codon:yes stop_codon:yes gene_type:complete